MSESTYDRLIRPIEAAMIRTVWRILRNSDDADDALQEALERIWKNLPRVERHPNPKALVLRICANTAFDTLRRKIRRRRREGLTIPESLPDAAAAPDETADRAEQRHAILDAVARLPRRQAMAVMLRLGDGAPYETIATELGCSPATARTHVKRGRARLRRLLHHLAPAIPNEVEP